MNDINNEFENANEMMKYFSENIDKLPVAIQLQVITEFMKFSENLKPLYVMALMLRGDRKED